jgi:superfamily I DNA/RNA helicase
MKDVHILILKAFDEFKFNLGKKTLIDFLKGNPNKTIEKNHLDELNSYGILYKLEFNQILYVIETLLKENYLEVLNLRGEITVINRSKKGLKEIYERKFQIKNLDLKQSVNPLNSYLKEDEVSDADRKLFSHFDFFLKDFNDNQKKAIISPRSNILCVAGAGCGKTTVLTKRIEFLIKFRSVLEKDILAITFTRKAREEMENKLLSYGIDNVRVETFNSFCEKILRREGRLIYEGEFRIISYRDKIQIVRDAMKKYNFSLDQFAEEYFSRKQIREKSNDELFFILVNDIFSIVDFYKNIFKKLENFEEKEKYLRKKEVARIIRKISQFVYEELRNRRIRDFSDQILDCLDLFSKYKEKIPKYKHILVDEFQDVNEPQFKIIESLNSENLFAVGDPRQAIYGWRGSDIKFILNFPKSYVDSQVIFLKDNYRSNKNIVDFFNKQIESLKLPSLNAKKEGNNSVFLFEQANESLEREFVSQAILSSKTNRNEIFVIARTNRILENFAEHFDRRKISYSIKTDDDKREFKLEENQIILSTIHSIKGMEAKEVYLVSANTLSFPNKVADNFVFSLVKEDFDYDKYAEELRLFYVAISRAKEKLVLTYTGSLSKFVSDEMLLSLEIKKKNKSIFEFEKNISTLDHSNQIVLKNLLKNWRSKKAEELSLPMYMVISNSAIDEIVKYRPQNKFDLLNIKGLGDVKIAKYGDEIIKILYSS